MNVKDIFEKFKAKSLNNELKDIKKVNSDEYRTNILDEFNFISSLSCKDFFLEMSKEGKNLRKNKSYYISELEHLFSSRDIWNKIELEGDFTKDDFKYEDLKKISESEKTKRLIFLLNNYKKVLQDEKNKMLSYSAIYLDEDTENLTTDSKLQSIQARYELYKYLKESQDDIPKIYKTYMKETAYGTTYLLDMLENKNFDKFLNKQNNFYKNSINKLKENISEEEILKLKQFFKDIKKKFGFTYKSVFKDFETYINYEEENSKIEELENFYVKLLEVEKEEVKKKQEELEKIKKQDEKTRIEQEKKQETVAKKVKSRIDFDEGNIDEQMLEFKEKSISKENKENIKILIIHWIDHSGEGLKEVLDKNKRDFLFDKIKRIANMSNKRLAIALCTDDSEESLRRLINSFEKEIKEYDIENANIECATGEHGRFFIDSQRKRYEMYNMPQSTRQWIKKMHTNVWENSNEYLDEDNQSFIQYNLPCSNKNGERLTDYLTAFRLNFARREKNIRYYPIGKKGMLVLAKQQFQENVIEKVLNYCKEKYNFTDKDVNINLQEKDEKNVGDDKDK